MLPVLRLPLPLENPELLPDDQPELLEPEFMKESEPLRLPELELLYQLPPEERVPELFHAEPEDDEGLVAGFSLQPL
jgi:hypothetical protein